MLDFLKTVEAKLDEYGRPAWLATMVLGFVVFVPLGLAILGYMLWSERMGCWGRGKSKWKSRRHGAGSGNSAFDSYREATLRRLEDEQEAFTAFLDRLRQAKDQAEFDQFMAEQRAGGSQTGGQSGGQTGAQGPTPQAGPSEPSGFAGQPPQFAT